MFCLELQAKAVGWLVLEEHNGSHPPTNGPVAGKFVAGPAQCCRSPRRATTRRRPAGPIQCCAGTGCGVIVEGRPDGRLIA